MPPWTPEEAIEKARKGGRNGKGKKKRRSFRGALGRIIRLPADSGPEWGQQLDDLARALVKAGKDGDIGAIKIILERWDGPLIKRHQHEHRAAVSLIDRSGDPRARTVDVSKPARIEAASSSSAAESQLAAGGSQVGGDSTADVSVDARGDQFGRVVDVQPPTGA